MRHACSANKRILARFSENKSMDIPMENHLLQHNLEHRLLLITNRATLAHISCMQRRHWDSHTDADSHSRGGIPKHHLLHSTKKRIVHDFHNPQSTLPHLQYPHFLCFPSPSHTTLTPTFFSPSRNSTCGASFAKTSTTELSLAAGSTSSVLSAAIRYDGTKFTQIG